MTSTWKLNNMLVNNWLIKEEIKQENQKLPWDKSKWKHKFPVIMGDRENSSKRELHSYMGLPKEETYNKKFQISNLILHLSELEKEHTKHILNRWGK